MASTAIDCEFPVGSLVPKTETGVLLFLQKYPEYDGRNVTIAIMDSGTDPKAAGLQTTSDGEVKVIERFDCTGCGDTNTSKKVTANSEGIITGLSGKQLKISNHMKDDNINGNEYHIGLKSFYDIYPSKIREKISIETKIKEWDESNKKAVADTARALSSFENQNSDPQSYSLKEKLIKENLESYLEFLNNYDKKYNDIKITYDCIVYRTEKCWYAVIDTSENGDLQNGVTIGEYSVTHEVKNIDEYFSTSINVHDDGNILEFVGMCSSHGTHVASIASGNHSNKKLDGIAPNAKIVALTIGDGRLGSQETGTSLVRAIIKVMELCNSGTRIDIINTSYGEHAHWSNSGRVGELMNEVINKYGVVWVSSAGNHGPALCTIGTPPDISQPSLIGVGAYISPQMMEAEYALREKLPANVYTWSSRDPCLDGGQGVTICAPGAAITSVPEFTMSRAQLMNGTSMSSPHVAGAIALLISGLKEKGIKYSPYSIKRAISNTATLLSYVDKFAQGNGLLNVDKAFEYLLQYANQPENLIRFLIKIGNQNAKGIHLRQIGPLTKIYETSATIEPIFINEREASPQDKLNFNVRLNLTCSESWVQCGAFLDLCYSARTISIRIDPTSLQKGVHTAKIRGYDTSCIEKGPLFEIPITVVQPHVLDTRSPLTSSNSVSSVLSRTFIPINNVEFKPNTIQRDFILVPNNATWAVLKMIAIDNGGETQTGKYFVHTMQILSMQSCKALETMKILPVNVDNETIHAFKVEQNSILELCIAKYWSSFGDAVLRYSLEFHGISSTSSNTMHAANGIHRIDLNSLGNEELSPLCQLKTATIILKPTESKITPLSSRDIIPVGRQIYQNLLTYNLHINKTQELSLYVPILCSLLYESEYESQMWMLFDSNKAMITCGDAYSNLKYFKLDKGDYTIRLQIRHEKKDILEKMNETNMLASIKLQNPITLDIYDHYNQSITSGKKMSATNLIGGVPKTLFIPPLTNDKLNKASIPPSSSWLNGTIIYAKDELGRKCDINSFNYILIDTNGNNSGTGNSSGSSSSALSSLKTSISKNKNNGSPKRSNKNKFEDYKDGLRDYKCSMIPKLDLQIAEEIYDALLAEYPKQAQIHLALIQNLETNMNSKGQYPFAFYNYIKSSTNNTADDSKPDINKLLNNSKRIIELANNVIDEIDTDVLLTYYGLKTDNRPDAAKIKTNMDKQKNMLLDGLVEKGINMCKLHIIESDKDKENQTTIPFSTVIDNIYMNIAKFIDVMDIKVIHFAIWHAYIHGHYGRMTKYLQKFYDERLSKYILEELSYIAAAKKWTHIENIIKRQIVSANPMGYRPF